MYFVVSISFILTSFYAVYFGKMFLQKRNGIQTNQMAFGNKEKRLVIQEQIMRIVTFLVIVIEVLSIILNWTLLNDNIRHLGVFLALCGVIVFVFSIVTMKDSWRAGITNDETSLITFGIYKFSRNPAFLGFYLVYIGVLLSFFSFILLIITFFAILSLHIQIINEEKNLVKVFGTEYIEYKIKVNRYLGRKFNDIE